MEKKEEAMDLKQFLLKNKVIWKTNACIKSLIIQCRYKCFSIYYKNKKNLVLEYPKLNKKPNILFIGTDQRQDNSGFYQALLSQGFPVLPFTTAEGEWGQYKSSELRRKEKNGKRLKELLENNDINCVIMQAWGASFDVEEFCSLKEQYKLFVINIDMDSRLIYKKILSFDKYNSGILEISKCSDLVLVNTREIVEWYCKEGIPAIYFPLASSSIFYYPIQNEEKIYDVGFIGSSYGIRGDEIRYLQSQGINVEARGNGWPNGTIAFEENNRFFNRCRIVLGIGNISYCKKFFNPKLRDYDAPMSGAVYITNRTPELENDYIEDKEIVLMDNWADGARKIKELLLNEEKMQNIRTAAHVAARDRHSYELQLKNLFNMLNLWDVKN